jgi:uncharacterized membrane protein
MRGGLPGSDSRFMAAAMTEFLLALLAFVAAHVLPARMGLRDRGVALWGERAYLAVYALLSVALLAWLISAAPRAPVIPLWSAGPAGYHFALTLMLPACVLLAGGAASPNPLSINFGVSGYDPSRPGLVGVTRHPLLWGFFLWAVAHLIPNGDLVSLILFGGFALFALLGMVIIDRRKRRQLGEQCRRCAGGRAISSSLWAAALPSTLCCFGSTRASSAPTPRPSCYEAWSTRGPNRIGP